MYHIGKLRYMRTCYKISYYYHFVSFNSFGYVLPGGQTQDMSWMLAREEVGLITFPSQILLCSLCNFRDLHFCYLHCFTHKKIHLST